MKTSQRQHLPGSLAGLTGITLLLSLVLAPGVTCAQEQYTYSVGILGGIGGSFDATPGDSYSNPSYQLDLSMVTEPRTLVGLRIGRIDLNKDAFFGSLQNADLTYATIGGEYRFQESYYESGLFLGLGAYRLNGTTRRAVRTTRPRSGSTRASPERSRSTAGSRSCWSSPATTSTCGRPRSSASPTAASASTSRRRPGRR